VLGFTLSASRDLIRLPQDYITQPPSLSRSDHRTKDTAMPDEPVPHLAGFRPAWLARFAPAHGRILTIKTRFMDNSSDLVFYLEARNVT
jgi:hypothetical protein